MTRERHTIIKPTYLCVCWCLYGGLLRNFCPFFFFLCVGSAGVGAAVGIASFGAKGGATGVAGGAIADATAGSTGCATGCATSGAI